MNAALLSFREQARSYIKRDLLSMNDLLNLQGYGPMLAQGAWMTLASSPWP